MKVSASNYAGSIYLNQPPSHCLPGTEDLIFQMHCVAYVRSAFWQIHKLCTSCQPLLGLLLLRY